MNRERMRKATEFRKSHAANQSATRKLIRIDALTPEEILEYIDLYPQWNDMLSEQIEVKKDSLYQYNNKLYKAITTHLPQENWNPERDSTLWDPIQPDGVIPNWEQRYGHNQYQIGDKVIWKDEIYECVIPTTYNPDDRPVDWEKLTK